MADASSLRFRLLLGLAKRVIFGVDALRSRPANLPAIGQSVSVPSQTGHLAGWHVAPLAPPMAAVLLLHGIGDRPHYWRRAQSRLAESGIASLVFAYPGYPGSHGTTTPANLYRDAQAAFSWLGDRVPPHTPIFVLGFSLGSGLAAQVAGELRPAPAGIILAEAFTSLRQAAARVARPAAFLARSLPDVWNTRENVARLQLPLLIIHSTSDALFPAAMAEAIYATADKSRTELKLLAGHAHNAPYLLVPEDYWAPIVAFIVRIAAPVPPAKPHPAAPS